MKPIASRQIQPEVSCLLEQFPAVAILGPRQVGETTLAMALAAVVVADPRIAGAPAGSLGEMSLVNLFCKLSEQGTRSKVPALREMLA
jgi:hypothetical protein